MRECRVVSGKIPKLPLAPEYREKDREEKKLKSDGRRGERNVMGEQGSGILAVLVM